MTTKDDHIKSIMERATKYFDDLFSDSPGQAWMIASAFQRNLSKLTKAQLEVVDNPELDMVSISHDVRGIAFKDRHFLPRIRALQKVTPYLT